MKKKSKKLSLNLFSSINVFFFVINVLFPSINVFFCVINVLFSINSLVFVNQLVVVSIKKGKEIGATSMHTRC